MRSLYVLLLAFLLLVKQGFSAPIPTPPEVFKPGAFVGVRPIAYEKQSKENRKVIHPGVVISGPSAEGLYQVAMISKNLPNDPPKEPIETFHPGVKIYGSVSLAPPKDVHGDMMKPWTEVGTGKVTTPMSLANLEQLKETMKGHVNWKPVTTTCTRNK